MRKIHLLGLIFIILLTFNGCATPTLPTLTQPFRAWVKTWEIGVTSEPSGADAYVNGAFIGKTPAVTQLRVYYNTLGVPEEQPPKVLVAKQGYQTEATTPELLNPRGGFERITIKFTLAEEGSSQRGHVGTVKPPEYVGSVQNVRVSADLTEGLKETINTVNKRDWQTNKPDLNDKTLDVPEAKNASSGNTFKEEENLYNLIRNIKTFEYEGRTYNFAIANDKNIIRGNRVIFGTNFLKEGEYLLYDTQKGKQGVNLEIFTAEVSDDGKLTNIKRLTKTIDKNEGGAVWTDDGNIAYFEYRSSGEKTEEGKLSTSPVPALMDSNGNFLRYLTKEELYNWSR